MSKKNTFARRRLSARRGTQGLSRGAPSPPPLNPHPIQVPPAAQVRKKSTYGALESRRGHWSTVHRRSPPEESAGRKTGAQMLLEEEAD